MKTPHTRRLATHVAAVCTVAALMAGNPTAEDIVSPVVEGLDGPRGIAVGPGGRLQVTENDGTVSEVPTKGHNAGAVTILGPVPANFIAPAISSDGRGQIYVLTPAGPPGSGAMLFRFAAGGEGVRAVADIAAYQETDPDP